MQIDIHNPKCDINQLWKEFLPYRNQIYHSLDVELMIIYSWLDTLSTREENLLEIAKQLIMTWYMAGYIEPINPKLFPGPNDCYRISQRKTT